MGIGLAHIGEFAFVVVLLGVESGILTETDYQYVVAMAVGSLIATPLLMKVGLRMIRNETTNEATDGGHQLDGPDELQAVVIGAGTIGRSMASQLETLGNDVCLVDLSPLNLHSFAQEGFRTVSGDATDASILASAGVAEATLVVVCVPDDGIALLIVRAVRRRNLGGRVLVRCRYQSTIRKLEKAGASEVVAEESLAALALLRLVTPATPPT
jgi:CPA2 family monovalent cation:H+ antiporter-2